MNHLNPKKILVIKLRSFGDTVIMTAPLEDLRKNYPNSKIDVLVTTQWAPILENNPFIDKIIPYTKRFHNSCSLQ